MDFSTDSPKNSMPSFSARMTGAALLVSAAMPSARWSTRDPAVSASGAMNLETFWKTLPKLSPDFRTRASKIRIPSISGWTIGSARSFRLEVMRLPTSEPTAWTRGSSLTSRMPPMMPPIPAPPMTAPASTEPRNGAAIAPAAATPATMPA